MTWQGLELLLHNKQRENQTKHMEQGCQIPDKQHHNPWEDWEQTQPALKCLSLLLEGTFPSALEGGGTQREPVISLSGGNRDRKSRRPSTRGESCAVGAPQGCRGAPRGSDQLLICARVQENHQRHGEEVCRSRQSHGQNIPRVHREQCIVSKARVERCRKCCGGIAWGNGGAGRTGGKGENQDNCNSNKI